MEIEIPVELLEDHITHENNIRGGVKVSNILWDELSGTLVIDVVIFDEEDETSGSITIF